VPFAAETNQNPSQRFKLVRHTVGSASLSPLGKVKHENRVCFPGAVSGQVSCRIGICSFTGGERAIEPRSRFVGKASEKEEQDRGSRSQRRGGGGSRRARRVGLERRGGSRDDRPARGSGKVNSI